MTTGSKEQVQAKPANTELKEPIRPNFAERDRLVEEIQSKVQEYDSELTTLNKRIKSTKANYKKLIKERNEVQEEYKKYLKTQLDLKGSRQKIQDQIKIVDTNIKKKNTEINTKLGKNKSRFGSAAGVSIRIKEIEDSISSGKLTLVEEKVLEKQLKSLNKVYNDFKSVVPIVKSIGSDEKKVTALKEEFSSLNPREVTAKVEQLQNKLKELQNQVEKTYSKEEAVILQRDKLHQVREDKYAEIQKTKRHYNKMFKNFKKQEGVYKTAMKEQLLNKEERKRLRNLAEAKESIVTKIQERLIQAKIPAFRDEVKAIEGCLVALDQDFKPETRHLFDNDMMNETVSKPVEKDDDIVLVEYDDDEAFLNTAPSKSKKIKKKQQQQNEGTHDKTFLTKIDGKITLEPLLISTLAEFEIVIPISQEELEKTISQLREKRKDYIERQKEVTEKNILTVEKELERVEQDFAKKEATIKGEMEKKKLQRQMEKAN
ncbi:uncharacterized protein NDAI_0E02460 [Naumovozyma dairenensis CBS 421]|uniref:Nuclear segregation protein BFR1 n=1 Tax=Naumovozyma dairenensis (strain ATCC 10597 / BCRC 20456 / CBS 421 / NBRC 0211 / NRRL Y-12639) TaxID=1071378 RepID=G0WBE3_NAUDC|nr:hypothetical protein NDAI_0E02460 [Naumovozyma dairenensis CBS 421]CCD25063.1 hypothetical protein NDAI_0E02460 [Naumovozyma dairenensis CBS 421]